jgi:hypothetical protein
MIVDCGRRLSRATKHPSGGSSPAGWWLPLLGAGQPKPGLLLLGLSTQRGRKYLPRWSPPEAIEVKCHNKTVSRDGENERTCHYFIFLMCIVHSFLRTIQTASNSSVSAIGVPSSDSARIDKTSETFFSRFPATLIESRRTGSRLARNRAAAASKV